MSNIIVKYGILSMLIALWAMGLTTWVTLQMFTDITAITGMAATAYGTFFGLPSLAFGIYKWRNKDVVNHSKLGPETTESE